MLMAACGRSIEVIDACTAQRTLPTEQGRRVEVVLQDIHFEASVHAHGQMTYVDLGVRGAFRFAPGEAPVEVLRWPADAALRDEFLSGPVLLSALARSGIYALHASAFRIGGNSGPVLAISAPSGTGKSTLARAALRLGWERVADDLLPLMLAPDSGVLALPHFPQLKLAPDEQYPADRPVALPLAALVRLRRADEQALANIDAAAGMYLVLASTIASRLFPEPVLKAHFQFAASVASAAAGGRLRLCELQIASDPLAVERIAGDALLALHSAIIDGAMPPERRLG